MARIVRRLLCFTGLLVIVCAGNAFCAGGLPIQADPFEIRDRIAADPGFDVVALWRKLDISPELHTVYQRTGVQPESPAVFDACEDCAAEIHEAEFGLLGTGIILKVCRPWGYCRFLVFLPLRDEPAGRSRWRFIGHADHDFARYFIPEHRIETAGKATYLVMVAQGLTGTGASLDYERWYEVSAAGMNEVLSLPVRGHECPDDVSLCRSFQATVLPGRSTDRRLEVAFTVTYRGSRFLLDGSSREEVRLFSRRQQAIFVREGPLRDFRLSSRESESAITMDEIRSVFSVGTMTCNDFIRFNTEELTRLASGPDSESRDWVRAYLLSCEPTPERDRALGFFSR